MEENNETSGDIQQEKEQEECIFCKIANKKINTEVIEENDNFIAFPDANPKTEGHTLIVPKKHFTNILDLPASLGRELLEIIKKVGEKKLNEEFEGFNIAMNNGKVSGQAVMHAHIHLLPRKKEDKFSWSL